MKRMNIVLCAVALSAATSATYAGPLFLGPVNPGAENITADFKPADWFFGETGGGFVNATPTSGFNGTGGFGIGNQDTSGDGTADLRSQEFLLGPAANGDEPVDFSFQYRFLTDFPSAGFPVGPMRVQLRFFGGAGNADFKGEQNIILDAVNDGTWQTLDMPGIPVPAGANYGDIRVSVNVFEKGFIGGADLDNFSVSTVPEPVSAVLLMLGGVAIALRRRRS